MSGKQPTLDRVISIQIYTDSKDASGAPVSTWSNYKTVFANVVFDSGSEPEIITKETAVTKVTFTIRHRTDLDTKLRILYNSKYYNILAILDDQDNHYLILKTQEVE